MADLLLKVGTDGPNPARQDGDVITGYNDAQILTCHSQWICHVKKMGFTGDGLRPARCLADVQQEKTYQYKFERVSANEVKRILLSDMSEKIISQTPNAKGEYMDVAEFVRRRIKHRRHRIFGTPGREYWYGGRRSADKVSEVWDEIEAQTAFRRTDYSKYPFTRMELSHHFAICTTDFTSDHLHDLIRSEYDRDPGEPGAEIAIRHVGKVNWRALGIFPEADINDRKKCTDGRTQVNDFATVIETKSPHRSGADQWRQ